MRLIKVALANVETTVGAVRANAERVIALARRMAREDVTVGAFPEQVLGGYPPEDLVQWGGFVDAQRRALERFARETGDLPAVYALGLVCGAGWRLFNAAAIVHRGRILGLVPKEKLPTYGVFYERRTLSAGYPGLATQAGGIPLGDFLFEFDAFTLAVEICEDGWSPDGPMKRRCYSGAELVVNLSASPFRLGIAATRREMLATRSADNQATLLYVNAIGGQDGLVFDGGGFVFQNGRLLLEAPRFREGGLATAVLDLDRTRRLRRENTTWRSDAEAFLQREPAVPGLRANAPTAERGGLRYPQPPGGSFFLPPAVERPRSPREELLDDLFEALALGAKDYFEKSGCFRRFGVALSGGRDSVLSLLVAWRAVELLHPESSGAELRSKVGEAIAAFYMPTRYSTEPTRAAAARICEELAVPLRVLPLDDALDRETEATRAMLGGEGEPTEVTRQNIQARLRGLRMWNWSNSAQALFLQTSDMSERAVGYTTIGGDLEGGLSVIANVPKTLVVALLERLRARFGFEGIARALETVPGPELARSQAAEEELMPFEVLDACLHLYAAEKLSGEELASALPDLFPSLEPERLCGWARKFVTLFTRSIYKWVQSPITLHVGSLDLERERALQLPVVERDEWSG
jgi:NAD+ synthase (glutamine-hydrolysing)